MEAEYSPRSSLYVFSLFLLLGFVEILLQFWHIPLKGFLGFPFWIFFLPLCLWEFYFWGQKQLSQKGLQQAYILYLLLGGWVIGFFYPGVFFISAIIMEILLIQETLSVASKKNRTVK